MSGNHAGLCIRENVTASCILCNYVAEIAALRTDGEKALGSLRAANGEIYRLRAEVERLKDDLEHWKTQAGKISLAGTIDTCRANARAEAAEKALDAARREVFVDGADWGCCDPEGCPGAKSEANRRWPEETKP